MSSTARAVRPTAYPLPATATSTPRLSPLSSAASEPASRPETSLRQSRVMGDMAHDLRGLITVVKGYAELILEDATEKRQAQHLAYCGKILRSCGIMSDLLDSCLELDRIETGKVPLCPKQLDLEPVLQECLSAQGRLARNHSVTLALQTSDPLEPVTTDPLILSRAVRLLLASAIKLSPAGAMVTLAASASRGEAELLLTTEVPLPLAASRATVGATSAERAASVALIVVRKLVEAQGGAVVPERNGEAGASLRIRLLAALRSVAQGAVALV